MLGVCHRNNLRITDAAIVQMEPRVMEPFVMI